MRNELDNYVLHRGNYTPLDSSEYENIGAKCDYCVFCDNPHEDFDTVLLSSGQSCGVCEDCDYEIKLVQLANQQSSLDDRTRDNIYRFREYGALPEHSSRYSIDHPQSCIFCTKVVDISNCTKFQLPVGTTEYNFNEVQCCKDCSNLVIDQLDSWMENSFMDKCVQCGDHYPITYAEHSKRYQDRSHHHHYCPQCWIGKYDPLDARSINVECKSCFKPTKLDRTRRFDLNPTIQQGKVICQECQDKGTTSEHVRWDLKAEEAINGKIQGPNDIRILHSKLANPGTEYTHVIDNIYAVIHKTNEKYYFEIIEVSDSIDEVSASFNTRYTSRYREEKIENVMAHAVEIGYKIYYGAKDQLKL